MTYSEKLKEHPAYQPRGARNFKSKGCSPRMFREIRQNQDALAAHMRERRRQWFAFDLDTVPEWPGCYAVYIDGILTYIGQTENAKFRFQSHRAKGCVKKIEYGRVVVKLKLPRRYGEWAMTEIRLIKRLQPVLNRARVASMEGYSL